MKNYNITVNGKIYSVTVEDAPQADTAVSSVTTTSKPSTATASTPKSAASESIVTSPMAGAVLSVKIKSGDKVKGGDIMLTLAASNVETEILAPLSGTIMKVSVAAGNTVNVGDSLVVF